MCVIPEQRGTEHESFYVKSSPESTSIFDLIIQLYLECQGNWKALAAQTGVSIGNLDLFLEYATVFLGNIGNYYVSAEPE